MSTGCQKPVIPVITFEPSYQNKSCSQCQKTRKTRITRMTLWNKKTCIAHPIQIPKRIKEGR